MDVVLFLRRVLRGLLALVALNYAIAREFVTYYYRHFFPGPLPVRSATAGRVALITGAGRGIGRELAVQLARDHGYRLILWDLNGDTLSETVQIVRREAIGSDPVLRSEVVDVTREEDVAAAARSLMATSRGLEVDLLVNNAGIARLGPLLKKTAAEIRGTYEVNVLAHYWTVRAFLPAMIRRRRGHIVAMSSITAHTPIHLAADYCPSKRALVAFMDCLEAEIRQVHDLRDDEIRLTTICPVVVNTGLMRPGRSRIPAVFPDSLETEAAVREMVAAILRGHPSQLILPNSLAFRWAIFFLGLMPPRVRRLIRENLNVYEFEDHIATMRRD